MALKLLKKYALVLLVASLLVNIVTFAVVLPSLNAFNLESDEEGSIKIQVVDGTTDKPLPNATVCIPEVDGYFKTGADGSTEEITVPILKNPVYESVEPQTWGEITLLVYKEGYVDFIIFHIMVREDYLRDGPRILLFPSTTGSTSAIHTLIESPDDNWVRAVRDKYKK